ncbi:MAG: hypothetical protein V1696_03240 [Candidatus Jorgensenbacteria bacterium]
MKGNLSNKIEHLRYLLRWNLLPSIILFGGIYVVLDLRYTELGFLLSLVGVFSLALWANHNRPKSYSDYLKNIEQKEER